MALPPPVRTVVSRVPGMMVMHWRRSLFAFTILFSLVVSASFSYGIFLLVRGRDLPVASREALAPTIHAPDVDALLRRAREHGDKREAEQALIAYRRILATAPTVEAQLGLAEAELQAGREAEAIQEFERTLRLDPRNATALERLARLYSHRRETWLKAEQRYRDYLALRPDDRQAQLGLARLLAWRGRGKEALALYSRSEIQPLLTPQDRRAYALALVEAGRGNEAQGWLEAILSASPSDHDVRLALAGVHASRGQWRTALPLYRAVLETRPEDASLNLVVGQGLLSVGEHEAAVGPLEKATRAQPSNREAALAYARALRGTGELKQADRQFERVMAHGEQDPAVVREYADLLVERKSYRRAEAYYRKALALGLRDERLLIGLASALRENGKPQQALPYLEEAYKLRPTDRVALDLARLYRRLGQNDRALQILAELERSAARR